MKIVVALATDEGAKASLEQIAALKFPRPTLHLVHAINLYSYATIDTSGFGGFDYSAEISYALEAEAQRLTEAAAEIARKLGFSDVTTKIVRGDAGGQLMTYADTVDAELIAVNASAARPAEAFIGGSVARKLAIAARQSILISRPGSVRAWRGDAIFATDQSKYSQTCAELLTQWRPAGLKTMRVLTAYRLSEADEMRKLGKDLAPRSEGSFSSALLAANQDFGKTLQPLGVAVESVVFAGEVHDAIDREVAGKKPADLLILGSQGKGFFARLRLGSTSLRQVETGNFPILVLRPKLPA